VSRDDEIAAIIELGRRTRKPTPRWLWIVSLAVAVICVVAFAAVLVSAREPARPAPVVDQPAPVGARPVAGSGLGIGLAIGVAVGVVIGFSIGRQRRSHSSRNSP
jgi:hypothetical protein